MLSFDRLRFIGLNTIRFLNLFAIIYYSSDRLMFAPIVMNIRIELRATPLRSTEKRAEQFVFKRNRILTRLFGYLN